MNQILVTLGQVTFLVILVAAILSGCQSLDQNSQAAKSPITPEAYTYTAMAHPLGVGQKPDGRTSGHGYLLLAKSIETPKRASKACQALFSKADLYKPAVAEDKNHLVTYLPVSTSGDFRRVSSLFKWGMCKRLDALHDLNRENRLLHNMGYAKTKGPILMAIDAPFAKMHSQQHSIVADLSMVPDHELETVIRNWIHGVASDRSLWHANVDLDEINERLNRGLVNRRVALSVLPDASTIDIALTESVDTQPAL